MEKLSLIQPDDWHLHLRDGDYLATTVAASARYFARAIIMPNLKPPVTSVKAAEEYQQRIINALPKDKKFQPLMTLYLTDQTDAKLIQAAKSSGFIYACKLYPAGATTHSQHGVTDFSAIYPALEAMQKYDIPLLIHGEVTNSNVDIFDREKYFLAETLAGLIKKFPELRIVLEHITTKEAVDFVLSAPKTLAATITAHHLLLNRNDIFVGGIHPHYYCLPILKRQQHQEALIAAATSGNSKFFLGTDSAPHPQNQKESACGCAGIYTAHAALEFYAEVFEQANALEKLEAFSSIHGPNFYRLPVNQAKITLIKKSWQVPSTISFGNEQLIPLRAGENVRWMVE